MGSDFDLEFGPLRPSKGPGFDLGRGAQKEPSGGYRRGRDFAFDEYSCKIKYLATRRQCETQFHFRIAPVEPEWISYSGSMSRCLREAPKAIPPGLANTHLTDLLILPERLAVPAVLLALLLFFPRHLSVYHAVAAAY